MTAATGAVADTRKKDLPLPAYASTAELDAEPTIANYLRHEMRCDRDLSIHAPAIAERVGELLTRHGHSPVRADEVVNVIAIALRDEAGVDYLAREHARTLAAAISHLFRQPR